MILRTKFQTVKVNSKTGVLICIHLYLSNPTRQNKLIWEFFKEAAYSCSGSCQFVSVYIFAILFTKIILAFFTEAGYSCGNLLKCVCIYMSLKSYNYSLKNIIQQNLYSLKELLPGCMIIV